MIMTPRPKVEDVRPLLRKWGVEQKKQKKIRPLADSIRDFEEKVIEVAQKLQAVLANQLERTFVARAAHPVATRVTSGDDGAAGSGNCSCQTGWAVDGDGKCTVCATAADNGAYGPPGDCSNFCDDNTCGAHGTCDTTAGTCTCACDASDSSPVDFTRKLAAICGARPAMADGDYEGEMARRTAAVLRAVEADDDAPPPAAAPAAPASEAPHADEEDALARVERLAAADDAGHAVADVVLAVEVHERAPRRL